MRILTYILGALALCVVAGASYLYFDPPHDFIRNKLQNLVESSTGRQLDFSGNAAISFNPNLVIELKDVSLSEHPPALNRAFITADFATVESSLWRAFIGQVLLTRIELQKPRVLARIDPERGPNWRLSKEGTLPADENRPSDIVSVLDGTVRISDGHFEYLDQKTGRRTLITNMSGRILVGTREPEATVEGRAVWGNETIRVAGTAQELERLLSAGGTTVAAKVTNQYGSLDFEGQGWLKGGLGYSGKLRLSSPSLRDTSKWLGVEIPDGRGLEQGDFEANVEAREARVRMEDIRLTLDNLVFRGTGEFRKGAPRPTLSLDLNTQKADLTEYAPDAGIVSSAGHARALSSVRTRNMAVEVVPAQNSLLQFLGTGSALQATVEPTTTARKASRASETTNEISVDPEVSRSVDAHVRIRADQLVFRELRIDNARLISILRDGELQLDLQEAAIGGGRAVATAVFNTRAQPHTVNGKITLRQIPATALNRVISDTRLLSGSTHVDAAFTGAGASLEELISSMNGEFSFQLSEGAIHGYDISQMVFQWWRKWSYDPARKMSFRRLTGAYKVRHGLAENTRDAHLSGVAISGTARGKLRLDSRWLDQNLQLRIVSPPNLLPIPLKVIGSWPSYKVTWDWSNLFADPASYASPVEIASPDQPFDPTVTQQLRDMLQRDYGQKRRFSPAARRILQEIINAGG